MMMQKLLYCVCVVLLAIGCKHPESKDFNRFDSRQIDKVDFRVEDTVWTVVKVKDGDTFNVSYKDSVTTVRLGHIDCPEKKQPYGKESTEFVSNLCLNRAVRLVHQAKRDRDRRLISEVFLEDGTNLNKLLVKEGLAWHFKKYSSDSLYAEEERKAKDQRKGLWIDENPIAPWDWRKAH